MKEIKDIIKAYGEALKSGSAVALATVVHVDGSAYRREGARMLISESGALTGAISGGCLEGDTLKKALLVMQKKIAALVTYDTMDDDAVLGIGLGCNGIIQVLIEPVNFGDNLNPIELLKLVAGKREPSVLVTMFSLADKKNTQYGTVILKQENNGLQSAYSGPYSQELQHSIGEAFDLKRSSFKNFIDDNSDINAFIEYIAPAVSIIIAGAGNDVQPLVKMADILGWETTVADGRPSYAKSNRFIPSCQVMVLNPAEILKNINLDDQTLFLLMTHNYHYDYAFLKTLISQPVKYIGILGPKKKWEKMLQQFSEEGVELSKEILEAIHTPVGLNIGAETPEEIALSILAEIKSFLAKKDAQQLKSLSQPIHHAPGKSFEEVDLRQKNLL